MKEATEELLWMSQKEETEVSRDWSDNDIELKEIEEYRKAINCFVIFKVCSFFFPFSCRIVKSLLIYRFISVAFCKRVIAVYCKA